MDDATQDPIEFWEHRYGERPQIWSGRPNQALVDLVAGLRPGRALDLGCGEGGDSIWLAEQGWDVVAVDLSPTAVARAGAAVAARGLPEGRIRWLVADLATWEPDGPYDLVSACFLHSPVEFPRTVVLRRAAAAIASGGHLLIVGHAGPPPWSVDHHHEHLLLSPAEERAELALDDADWLTVVSETRPREATGPDGEPATLDDAVTLLRRR